MVRKTKEQAQATRSRILDTAELVFEARGVSGTSLHEIAEAAGLTRGAIYWHFDDKADLFNAMMERAKLPLEEARGLWRAKGGADITLSQLRAGLIGVLARVVADPQMRRVFGIAMHKVEYTGETAALRERHRSARDEHVADLERTLRRARRRGEIGRRMPVRTAAIGLQALLDGLMQNWVLDPQGFDLVKVGAPVINAYLSSLTTD